tara:strand:- start:335 stop:508 length:174 start_codon:yes stop_codon:yes gene_type:complete
MNASLRSASDWLAEFAYRMDLYPWLLLQGGVIAGSFACLAVIYHSLFEPLWQTLSAK